MRDISTIIAGDSLDFASDVPGYPATDGWTLKYVLVPRFSTPAQSPITLTAATYETTRYRVQVDPTVTEDWTPGIYTWSNYVEQAGQRITREYGSELTVAANPATMAAGTDQRSDAVKALASAKAALTAYTANNGAVQEYAINGRRMTFRSADDITALIKHLQGEVVREQRAAAHLAGQANPSRFGVRLARV